MPPLPGETLLLNVFADVHYYFSEPSVKPAHDRFDKGSYVYLYLNSTQRRARLEIANAAGTPDQDAFHGYLDAAKLANSYKHPTLFSITVEDATTITTSPRPADQSQWHLPAFDPKNEQKYLYKIRSLDIYLWTAKDGGTFLDSLKRTLPYQQLDLVESAPPAEHDGSMSPIVQQLERIAFDAPTHARVPSAASSQARVPSAASNQAYQGALTRTPESQRSGSYFTSVAQAPALTPYNPAAPLAPEPIAHREKTPPPVDAATGTGLSGLPVHGQTSEYGLGSQAFNQAQSPLPAAFPGPPQRAGILQPLPPPPQPQHAHQSMHATPGFAPPPPPPSTQPQTQYASYPTHHSAHYPQSPGYPASTPMQSPGVPLTPGQPPSYSQHTPLQTPGLPHTPLQSPGLPPPPVTGYPSYTYAPQTQQTGQGAQSGIYGVHNQAYRPTEAEAAHGHDQGKSAAKSSVLEQRMGKMEKGVGRFFRKLDQKI